MPEFTVRARDGRYEVGDAFFGTVGIEDPASLQRTLNYIEMLLVGVSPEVAFRKSEYGLAAYIRETKE